MSAMMVVMTVMVEHIGDEPSGFLYEIMWWDKDFRRVLECATKNYSYETKNEIIDLAKKTNCVITAEDHNVIGGLGGAIAEVLSENYPCIMKRIGLQDRYAESGKPDELYKKYGLNSESIAEEAMKFVNKKR